MKPRILVVSSAYTDFFYQEPTACRRPGQSIVGKRYECTSPGGRGIYSAITLEQLGAECIFCARVGGDSRGARLKAFLRKT